MPLRIVGRNKDLTKRERNYIESRVDKLRKLVQPITVLDVFVSEVRHNIKIKLIVKAGRISKSLEETGSEVAETFDIALHKMETALRRTKEKTRGGNKKHKRAKSRAARAGTAMANQVVAVEDSDSDGIGIINERMSFKPMSVEEAAEQIDMNGRQLLVFVNDTSERLNVIYKRDDGQLGLIEPR